MTSAECAKYGANIIDISQTVMKEYFAMIMLTELDELTLDFSEFSEKLKEAGRQSGVEISVMHEDIFNAMHRI
jgi:ACT domain-containing protein